MRNARSKMIAKIQIEFPRLRPDIDPQTERKDLRDARLEFCRETLGLTRTPKSITRLSDQQLGRVLDRITKEAAEHAPRSSARVDGPRFATTCTVRQLKPKTAEALSNVASAAMASQPETMSRKPQAGQVIHLAGNEQTWAIDRLFDHLCWDDERRRKYVLARWGTRSERMLKPHQAGALLVQLLTIAAHKELREKGREGAISREETAAEIPALKRRLGIDRATIK